MGILKNFPLINFVPFIRLVALALAVAGNAVAAGDSGYSVVARWPIGSNDKWDYLIVDAPRHHLFLARATRVQVIDLDSGKLVGEIPNTAGAHGIALAHDLHRGFISNGKADSVTVFDLDTLATIGEIKISGSDPDAIIYDEPSHHIYAFNGHSNSTTVIDAAMAREIGTIPLPGSPEFAVSDGAGHVFVNVEDKSLVARIDVAKGVVQSSWSLGPCIEPTGIALDRARNRLFSVCHNEIMIVSDSESGRRITELAIGKHVDAAAFDPILELVFCSNGDSADVSVIGAQSGDHYTMRGGLATVKGSKTMALDTATHRIYVPAMSADGLQILVAAPR
jgi:YVTN family beta-propeller protein